MFLMSGKSDGLIDLGNRIGFGFGQKKDYYIALPVLYCKRTPCLAYCACCNLSTSSAFLPVVFKPFVFNNSLSSFTLSIKSTESNIT